MQTINKRETLFVGVDVHKDSHTAVGVSPFGEKLFEIEFGNYQQDFDTLSKKVELLKGRLSPYFGLEDCHGYGERLAEYLFISGYPVLHVPSVMVDRQRKNNTHPEKSDSLDAYGIAEVMIQKTDTLPKYILTDEAKRAKQIKGVSQDRNWMVEEQSRLKNHLHEIFHKIWNTEYRSKFKDPFSLKAMRYWLKAKPVCDTFLLRSMKRKVKRMISLREEIIEAEKELAILLKAGNYTIQTAS